MKKSLNRSKSLIYKKLPTHEFYGMKIELINLPYYQG